MNVTVIQNKSQRETLGSGGVNIIDKLYELATDSNNSLTLEGWIKSPSAYGYQIDYLNTHFNDLEVETDNRYIKFEDPEFQRCVIAKYSTDGVGVTQELLDTVTDIGDPNTSGTFANSITNNTALTSMIDLLKFRNLTILKQGLGFGNTNVTEVGIPSSVTQISLGNQKFLKDSSIEKIYIPSIENFARINYTSFWGSRIFDSQTNADLYITNSYGNWEKLQIFNVASQVINNFYHRYTFSRCKTIQQVNIGYGVTSANGSMFQSCSNLTTVTIPTSITEISSYFDSCSNLTTVNNIDSNGNIFDIDLNYLQKFDSIFYGCTKLNLKVQYCPSWTVLKGYSASQTTNAEGISYYNGPVVPFGGCVFEHLYVPNLLHTSPQSFYRNYYSCSSFFGSSGNVRNTQYQVLYFKNIQTFFCGEFNNVTASAIVINNTTPPEFKNQQFLSDSYVTTNNINWESTKDTNFDKWNTSNKIYVPDPAVNDYKTAPIWSKVADYIYPMSDLQQYATKADWEAAGKPVGLIQAYMS